MKVMMRRDVAKYMICLGRVKTNKLKRGEFRKEIVAQP